MSLLKILEDFATRTGRGGMQEDVDFGGLSALIQSKVDAGRLPGRRSSMSMTSKYGPFASGYSFPDTGDSGGGWSPLSPTDYNTEAEARADYTYRHHRRINPLNAHAARRAVRRLRSSVKLLQSIERMLPRHHVGKKHAFHFPRRRHRR